jgi:hypothetical protein
LAVAFPYAVYAVCRDELTKTGDRRYKDMCWKYIPVPVPNRSILKEGMVGRVVGWMHGWLLLCFWKQYKDYYNYYTCMHTFILMYKYVIVNLEEWRNGISFHLDRLHGYAWKVCKMKQSYSLLVFGWVTTCMCTFIHITRVIYRST